MEGVEVMANDPMRDDLAEAMALAEEQIQELSTVNQRRMALSGKGTAADGLVEVTVDAQYTVTNTVIEESYLQEFELADLGAHVTAAARAAVEEVGRRGAALMAPLAERRQAIRSMAGRMVDAPEFGELLSLINPPPPPPPVANHGDDEDDGWSEDPRFPTVKR